MNDYKKNRQAATRLKNTPSAIDFALNIVFVYIQGVREVVLFIRPWL